MTASGGTGLTATGSGNPLLLLLCKASDGYGFTSLGILTAGCMSTATGCTTIGYIECGYGCAVVGAPVACTFY